MDGVDGVDGVVGLVGVDGVVGVHAREIRTTSKVSCERFRSSVIVL